MIHEALADEGWHDLVRLALDDEQRNRPSGLAHIARLVSTGATSREVGAQLFLSPRTIEAHLRNIFRKRDISSRRQLKELELP